MTIIDSNQGQGSGRRVNLALVDAKVTEGFRTALFDACSARNLTPVDFCLIAAADRLAAFGYDVPGVFRDGDRTPRNDNEQGTPARRTS